MIPINWTFLYKSLITHDSPILLLFHLERRILLFLQQNIHKRVVFIFISNSTYKVVEISIVYPASSFLALSCLIFIPNLPYTMAWPVLWVFAEKSQISNCNNIIEILKY